MTGDVGVCGCCEPPRPRTPTVIHNRAGLPALAYRVGTHGGFKAEMLTAVSREPLLHELTARDDDPAIALVDAWATALDVLTFYQERIANEGFLGTATERRSVYELGSAIGYQPDPGVAASVHLAFDLETAPGSPDEVPVPAGTAVQSLPGPDEEPQTFETVEAVTARGAWNALRAATSAPRTPGNVDTEAYLAGVATRLRPGDAVVFVSAERVQDPASSRWDFRVLKTVAPDVDRGITHITWDGVLTWQGTEASAASEVTVYALRRRAGLFGHNAPDWRAMPQNVQEGFEFEGEPSATDWPGLSLELVGTSPAAPNDPDTVYLDTVYPGIVTDGWLVLADPDREALYRVASVAEAARTDFTLSGKTTRLGLAGSPTPSAAGFAIRNTVVFAESEPLILADAPLTDPVEGDTLVLDTRVDDLERGRTVLVVGAPAVTDGDAEDVGSELVEVAVIDRAEPAGAERTSLRLAQPLRHVYDRPSFVVHANVALATHGEARAEILGDGDASQPFQEFTLKQSPLTRVPDPVTGAASTLEVRVNGVAWHQVASLHGAGPRDRVFAVGIADDGTVTVRFGDGVSGARPTTGEENITATYRVGTGRAGHVTAGQLSLLMTRALGVRSVTNPQPAAGGADPEDRDEARDNAPRTVLTFDRVVSLRDYEDFARAFPGVAKAQAAWLWDGEMRLVHLTVAGVDGLPIEPDSTTHRNLLSALHAAGDSRQALVAQSCEALTFDVTAAVFVDPDHDWDSVHARLVATLREAFSFARRDLGQAVTESEVTATAQSVDGVIAVDLDTLSVTGSAPPAAPVLTAAAARRAVGAILPAQLLTLNPDAAGLVLEERR